MTKQASRLIETALPFNNHNLSLFPCLPSPSPINGTEDCNRELSRPLPQKGHQCRTEEYIEDHERLASRTPRQL
jgi:hypothetical protein